MIRFVPEVGSTNAELGARLANGEYLAEGDWLVADRQTAGRGRVGRTWQDGAGNFMGSTIVRPAANGPPLFTLALVAGIAAHSTLVEHLAQHRQSSLLGLVSRQSQPDPTIMLKWPNDLIVDSAKLAGILIEVQMDVVIVGVGVNLMVAPTIDRRDTISLAQLGIVTDRDCFAHDLARQFALDLQRWRDFGLPPIIRRWCAAAYPEGTPLTVDAPGGAIEGRFAGLTDQGALRLRLATGMVREINAGEVRLHDQAEG